ncbi:hypothetical protein BH24DEI2_BH24DEI2_03710 [soil metagenome]
MDADTHIRAEIAKALSRKGMSQTDLAKQVGVKPQSIYPVLKGKRGKQPTSLLNILDALDLELVVRPRTAAILNLDADLLELLHAPTLQRVEGQGKPTGSKVVAGGSATEAVIADRDEQEHE